MFATINEMYPCILGESLDAGLCVMLVRFSGCNLNCVYCDTSYAATEPGQRLEVDDILDAILEKGTRRVLITGGEPLLQLDAVRELSARLLSERVKVMIETNGTLSIQGLPPATRLIMDVKTPGAGPKQPFFTENLEALRPRDQLKFVLTSREDYLWSLDFVRTHSCDIATSNVLFSPAWGLLEPATLAQWMLHDNIPYRFHLQIHKAVWGDKRGV